MTSPVGWPAYYHGDNTDSSSESSDSSSSDDSSDESSASEDNEDYIPARQESATAGIVHAEATPTLGVAQPADNIFTATPTIHNARGNTAVLNHDDAPLAIRRTRRENRRPPARYLPY
jgi:hypothetical protein